MKKIKYILIAIAGGLFTTSCNDLDLTPPDYYGSGNFWQNESQVVGFINGAHNQFRGHGYDFWRIGEFRGGTFDTSSASALEQNIHGMDMKTQNFSEERPNNGSWFNFYGKILNLNDAITQINKATYLSDSSKNFYLGQVHGLRAWYYFMMYRTYGGVPIKTGIELLEEAPTTATPLYTPRSTPKETLDFIKKDIAASEKYFTDSGRETTLNRGVWSYYATLMLKAETYLWSAKVTTGDQSPAATDLDTSKAALDLITASGKFGLVNSYAGVFDHNNKKNNEIIFAMTFLENEASTYFGSVMYAPNLFVNKFDEDGNAYTNNDPLKIGGGSSFDAYKYELFQAFDPADTRRATTFMSYYADAAKTRGKGVAMIKFLGFINSANTRIFSSDVPVYRYADVLLMYAEIENKKGGDPSSYINQIRQRAYGTAYNASTHGYTNSDFATNELTILKERDKEFVGEGKRWFDLIRLQGSSGKSLVFSAAANYGATTPILDEATEAHKVLWPVDVDVLSRDELVEQTPGYKTNFNRKK